MFSLLKVDLCEAELVILIRFLNKRIFHRRDTGLFSGDFRQTPEDLGNAFWETGLVNFEYHTTVYVE